MKKNGLKLSLFKAQLLKNESMMSESLNSSSSVGDNIMKSGNDSDFVRATAEVRELREEGSQLRQENIELKVCTSSLMLLLITLFNICLFILGTNSPIKVRC